MKSKLLISLCLGLALCVVLGSARKMTRAQRRRAGIQTNKWYRDVNANTTVKEVAAVLKNKERIFFKSADRKLRTAGIMKSVSYIDNKSDYMVVKAFIAGSRKCVLLPSNVTQDFNSTVDDILSRKKVNETAHVGDFVMSSGAVMSLAEREQFKGGNQFLAKTCRRNKLIDATHAYNETFDLLDKFPVTVLTPQGTVTMHISALLGLDTV